MKKLLRDNARGYTLTELIVTFALTGIFLTCAAAVISSCMKMYLRVTSETNAHMAADTILEKLTVDLTSASGEIPVIQNSSRGDVISYRDWEGRNVAVGISDKNILVWQYENPFENQEPEDWFYGPETYLGNEAADLRFNMQGTEVIQIILTLYDPIIDRSYEFSKMVSFETGQDG